MAFCSEDRNVKAFKCVGSRSFLFLRFTSLERWLQFRSWSFSRKLICGSTDLISQLLMKIFRKNHVALHVVNEPDFVIQVFLDLITIQFYPPWQLPIAKRWSKTVVLEHNPQFFQKIAQSFASNYRYFDNNSPKRRIWKSLRKSNSIFLFLWK